MRCAKKAAIRIAVRSVRTIRCPGLILFYHTTVIDIPGFDAKRHYPWANGAPGGPKLFKIVHDHLANMASRYGSQHRRCN